VKYIKILEENNPRRSILDSMKQEMFSELYNYLPKDMSLEEKFSILSTLGEIICSGDNKKLKETMNIIKTYGVDNNGEILKLGKKILLNSNKENLYMILNKIKRSKKNITENLKKLENIICNANTNNLQIIIETTCPGNNTEENITNLIKLDYILQNYKRNYLRIVLKLFDDKKDEINIEKQVDYLKNMENLYKKYGNNTEHVEEFVKNIKEHKK
jgi:predicted O-linked N-acetylglucosamine transferase (SPINDLY family)